MVYLFIPQISIAYTGTRWLFHFSQQRIIEHLLVLDLNRLHKKVPHGWVRWKPPKHLCPGCYILDVTAAGSRSHPGCYYCGLLVQWI